MRTKLVLWSALIWNMAINAAYPEPSFVFTTPVPVEELNSPRIDWAPWLSADGLTGYIGSDRDDSWTIYHI
ncbi:MAG: hypothetical protein N3D11_14005 [Candidatus Sumerlaeia bacterium]|nr:hypothetical protein [Candidatus Sumerlaeia bacterium]